jgi:hypothetical protein
MILTDLLPPGIDPTQEQIDNLRHTALLVSGFEDLLGLKFKCTSGLRSLQQHCDLYKRLREQDIANCKPPRPIPMRSLHLVGKACDFVCPTIAIKDLQALIKQNFVMEFANLKGAWFEDFRYTPRWIHCQTTPPASGKRFFVP